MNIWERVKKAYADVTAPEEATGKPDTKEVGSNSSSYWDKYPIDAYNPDDLQNKKNGLNVYDKMLNDEAVKSNLKIRKETVLSGDNKVVPRDGTPQAKEQSDFIEWVFTDGLEGSFTDNQEEIISAYEYGFSLTEKVFELRNTPWGLKYVLKSLKTRPPHSIDFYTDGKGNITKIMQKTNFGQIELPQDKFIIYIHNPKFSNFYGNSDLREAYRAWWSKDIMYKFRNIYGERFTIPTLHGKYPKGTKKADKDDLLDMLDRLQAKTSFITPEDVEIAILEVKTAGQESYNLTIEKLNNDIANALLVPGLIGMGNEIKGGSYNLAEVQMKTFELIANRSRKKLGEIIFEQLIRHLIDINFAAKLYPRYQFSPLREEDMGKANEQFLRASETGVIRPNTEQVNCFLKSIKYPIMSEYEINNPKPKEDDEKEEPKEEDKDKDKTKDKKEDKFSGNHKHFGEGLSRQPNKFEKRMNFAEIKNELDQAETKTIEKLSDIFRTIKDDTEMYVTSKKIMESKDFDAVKNLRLKYANEVRLQFRTSFESTYNLGRKRGAKAIKDRKYVQGIPPARAIEYFSQKALNVTDVVFTDTTNKVKDVLLNGLKNGKANKEVIYEIEKIFNPLVNAQMIPDSVSEPYRIETIVRTNFTDAYNQGLNEEFNEVDSFVAYQWSSILDDRTTSYCQSMDGQIFSKDDSRFVPCPAHFNCRSIIVPIFDFDEYELSTIDPGKGRDMSFGGKEI